MRDAMEAGRTALRADSEVTAAAVQRMGESERQAYRLGVARAIDDVINNTRDGRNVVERFFGTPNQRARIAAAFDSPEDFERFRTAMTRERGIADVNPQINPRAGSPTSRLTVEGADESPDLTPMLRVMAGHPIDALRQQLSRGVDAYFGVNTPTSNALAPLMFQTTPGANTQVLGILQAEARRRAFDAARAQNRNYGLLSGGAAAGASAGEDNRLSLSGRVRP